MMQIKPKNPILITLCLLFLLTSALTGCAATERKILSDEDERRILQTYSEEFAYISAQCGKQIKDINALTIDTIKHIAYGAELQNPIYEFEKMMEEIALSVLEYDSDPDALPATQQDVIVSGSYKKHAVATGNLTGKILMEIPVGAVSASPVDNTIVIEAGSIVQGYSLTASYAPEKPITAGYSGPVDDTTLENGKYATERIVFYVVSGTLIHDQWDYINDIGQLQHLDRYYIEPTTASMHLHTVYACFSSSSRYWAVENESGSRVMTFASDTAARNEIMSNPSIFIS